jgi:asparagine synthase (glutamine-hydrolysing)
MDADGFLRALDVSMVEALDGEERAAVAYSGGIDSALVAAVAGRHCDLTLYTCGTEGSKDLKDDTAPVGGMRRVVVRLGDDDVARLAAQASRVLSTTSPVPISYTIPTLSVLEAAEERLVLVGSGADELFAGYAKYTSMADPTPSMREDLAKMMVEMESLRAAVSPAGRRIAAPFTGKAVIDFADGLALDHKLTSAGRKLVLRAAAKQLGLEAHDRPKRAAQYSSGVLKAMERMAKAEGRTLAEWTASLPSRASP